ncbi:MAG: TlpA disulfide reductase family protein [Candidatus Aureabacteria bacterium]|nr:TlpA disulfide reductase family protein [Candidatus Auribacterota bacterium]
MSRWVRWLSPLTVVLFCGAAAAADTAADFTLKDLKGTEVGLSKLKGKAVLLVFSTTWCPHCRTEVPELKKFHERYKEKGLEILMVDIQESEKRVAAFVEKYGIPYRVLLDTDGSVANKYRVRGVPCLFLVGKDGTIICRECRQVEPLIERELGVAAKK